MRKNYFKKRARIKAFTLVEILIVIAVLAIVAVVTFVVINPAARLRDANNAQRRQNVGAIANAIGLYTVDNAGEAPTADGASLPSVTQADLAENGVSAANLDGIVDGYLAEIPSQPSDTVYYVGLDTDTGQPLVGAGIEQSDGSSTLFTNLYGQTGVAVTLGGEEGGGGGPLTPTGQSLISNNCGVIMPIANGATYVRGGDYPNGIYFNIKLNFADESLVSRITTNYTSYDLDGNLLGSESSEDASNRANNDSDGFFVKSDSCRPPLWMNNALRPLEYPNRRHAFDITIYGTDGSEETYNFSYTVLSS